MCGIAGLVGSRASDAEALARMLEALVHRGPDAGAARSGEGWAIGARRLAILDLVTGDQPVANESGDVIAVLNGEIYNYLELREELAARGHVLRSRGDTEVLVHLWEEHGPAMLERLRGMFALALVDTRRRTVMLARDRIGKKPLYWTGGSDGLAFASELKSLRHALGQRPVVDDDALSDYLRFGFVPEGRCIVRGVAKLAPGHALLAGLDGARPELRRYWRLSYEERDIDRAEAVEELRGLIDEAVRLRLRADVPLAVFLSGGIDSGLVAAAAARDSRGLRALTVSFDGQSELDLAQATARRVGIDLDELRVAPGVGLDLLDRLAEVFDEPLADSSAIPTLLVARAARPLAKVVLNGDGGDEALGGYRRLLVARALDAPGAGIWGPRLARLAAGLGARGLAGGRGDRIVRALADPGRAWLAWGPVKLTGDECAALLGRPVGQPEAVARVAADHPGLRGAALERALELEVFLPGDLLVKMDRATMAASLEARSPLLDHRLLEAAASMPLRLLVDRTTTKALLRDVARGVLPEAVRRGRKRGFEPPLAAWLSGPWSAAVRETLEDPRSRLREMLDGRALEGWLEWSRLPDRSRAARAVFTLLTLERWLRRWS